MNPRCPVTLIRSYIAFSDAMHGITTTTFYRGDGAIIETPILCTSLFVEDEFDGPSTRPPPPSGGRLEVASGSEC